MSKKEAKQEKTLPKRRGDRIKQHTKSPLLTMGGQKTLKRRRPSRKTSFSGRESIMRN